MTSPQKHPEIPDDHVYTRFNGYLIRAAGRMTLEDGQALVISSSGWVSPATVDQLEELFPGPDYWINCARANGMN